MKGLEELGTLAKHVRDNVQMLVAGQRLAEDSVLSPEGVSFLAKALDIRGVAKYDGTLSNEAISGNLLPNGFVLQAPLDHRMLFKSPLPNDFTSVNMWQLGSGAASKLSFTERRNMANPHYALEAYSIDSVFGGSGVTAAKTVAFEKDIYTDRSHEIYRAGTRLMSRDHSFTVLPLTDLREPRMDKGSLIQLSERKMAGMPWAPLSITHIPNEERYVEVVRFPKGATYLTDPEFTLTRQDGKLVSFKMDVQPY